jgi:hypothetical protein
MPKAAFAKCRSDQIFDDEAFPDFPATEWHRLSVCRRSSNACGSPLSRTNGRSDLASPLLPFADQRRKTRTFEIGHTAGMSGGGGGMSGLERATQTSGFTQG